MTTSPQQPTDRLFADAARGDATAAEALLQTYLPRLRAFVRAKLSPQLRARESDSDVVQSVCRELLQHQDGLQYRGETEFRGWLFTAAANKVREKYRFHRRLRRGLNREHALDSNVPSPPAGSSAAPSHAAMEQERLAILEAAMDGLSDSDREVVTLSRLVGLTSAEIAQRIGKTGAAVRQQLGRALLRLGAVLTEHQDRAGSR